MPLSLTTSATVQAASSCPGVTSTNRRFEQLLQLCTEEL
ncbi:Uncharacterised protein [Mycobacterium tuberculosis]|nr:Uncharacterised protein [Mycobacterium tuberculosis]